MDRQRNLLGKKLISMCALLFLGACAAGAKNFDAIMVEKVRTKAAFDFGCPTEQLSITRIDIGAYGATGCGKRASYVGKDSQICWQGNSENNLRRYCQVVPDTFVQGQ